MAGGGVALIGTTLVPLLSGLFSGGSGGVIGTVTPMLTNDYIVTFSPDFMLAAAAACI